MNATDINRTQARQMARRTTVRQRTRAMRAADYRAWFTQLAVSEQDAVASQPAVAWVAKVRREVIQQREAATGCLTTDRFGTTVLTHVRHCATCQSGTWCQSASRLGLTREQRDAVVAFDRALNPVKTGDPK